METNFFFVGIQRRRLASKVQPEEVRFGPELDWGKPWRGQVFGELEAAFGSESTKAVAGSGVRRSRSGVW